jgi:Tfp pilus assembly protein PilF/alkyl hydroperoxide reductase subunit AhpC
VNWKIKTLVVIVVLMSPLALPPPQTVAAFKYLDVGMTAPTVSGKDLLTGRKVSSGEKAADEHETICIAFWATWSPRSLELLADLETMYNRLSGQPFHVIAVNVDSQVTTAEVTERVKRTVTGMELPFPVIMDKELEIFYTYGVVAVPSIAVIDADKVVRSAPSGYSYAVRDRLTGSIETVLGLVAEEEAEIAAKPAYQPKLKALRYYNLAVRMTNQRLYEDALSNVDLAMAADPRFSAPYNLRGQIRLKIGEPGPALEDLKQAVGLDSISVSARTGLGRALLAKGDTMAALEQFDVALELDPSYTVALQEKGVCLAAMDRYDEAIALLKEVIELYPQNPQTYYYIGRVCRKTGKTGDALVSYRTALRMLFPGP